MTVSMDSLIKRRLAAFLREHDTATMTVVMALMVAEESEDSAIFSAMDYCETDSESTSEFRASCSTLADALYRDH